MDSFESRTRLARELAHVAASGIALTVVHGGGKQMTRFLADQGVESQFVNGLRVSGPDVIDAVLKVLAGTVNHELVASLVAAGVSAVGLSGIDAGLAQAEPMHPDLGAVGRITKSDGRILDLLTSNHYVPVVACVAGDSQGTVYNVNADQMAVACAAGFSADRLFFLTDVDGVKGEDGDVLSFLTPAEANHLIDAGVATGGMQAKLTAATSALANGIGEVVIAPGSMAQVLDRLLAGDAIGTRLSAGEGA